MKKYLIPILALATGSLLVAAPSTRHSHVPDSISQTARGHFQTIEGLTVDVATQASLMDHMDLAPTAGWLTQSNGLRQIGIDFGHLNHELTWLEQHHSELSPWEQELLARLDSPLALAAANTQQATVFFRDHSVRLAVGPYRGLLNSVEQNARQARTLLGGYLRYSRDQRDEQQIKQSLHIVRGGE